VGRGGSECRQVAFIWHLTRDWRPGWGGELYWIPSDRYLAPGFNTLFLFTVGPDTRHFVTAVAPQATGKRLAVNGWWTGPGDPAPGQVTAPATDPAALPRLEVL
jgi:Rps23 Pro-64 3,4-dihydroxylase Tpa1-like proline 4-hydroxylase